MQVQGRLSARREWTDTGSDGSTNTKLLHVPERKLESFPHGDRSDTSGTRSRSDEALSGQFADDIGSEETVAGVSIAAGLARTRPRPTDPRPRHLRRFLPSRVSQAMGDEGPEARRTHAPSAYLRDTHDGIQSRSHLRRPDHVLRTEARYATVFRPRRISVSTFQKSVRLLP